MKRLETAPLHQQIHADIQAAVKILFVCPVLHMPRHMPAAYALQAKANI